jgi:transcriptional regulator with GAF, ATPase, and Fis domain
MRETWGIKGSSAPVGRLLDEIRVLAPLRATALITGETGTGKGVVALALHRASGRAPLPFVHVDCAALAPSVIESELFGHERGAFTGAHRSQAGRLESAAQGTLFLDEIGEIGLPLQAKLLRVLQERVFERVGASTPRRFRARVVAATHRDLEAAVQDGEFRSDLYYRLNVLRIRVPPLRERLDDLPELIAEWVDGRPSAQLLAELRGHDWPGNIRELHNWLERRSVEDRLRSEGLTPLAVAETPRRGRAEPCRCERAPAESEPVRLASTLREVGGNVSRAARRLGMPRSTLRRRISRYGLIPLIPRD